MSKFIFRGPAVSLGRFGSAKNGDILDLNAAEVLAVAADTRFAAVPDAATVRRKIVTANYQALATDRIIDCNHTAGIAVTLPAAPAFGNLIEIFDVSAAGASVNNITIKPAAELIRGATMKVVSATVAAGGTGDLGAGAGVIVEGTTGTGTKFRASVTIAANAIASVQSISLAGAYTVNPAVLTAEPVIYISGAASGTVLTGAQLSVVMGLLIATDGGRLGYVYDGTFWTAFP